MTLKKSRIKLSTYQNQRDLNVSSTTILKMIPLVKKVVIFDMDETLIHCVDDVETDDPDVILEIDFPDEETVYVTNFRYLTDYYRLASISDPMLWSAWKKPTKTFRLLCSQQVTKHMQMLS